MAYRNESIWKVSTCLELKDINWLPVVEKEGSRRLVGVVRRNDIIYAYSSEI